MSAPKRSVSSNSSQARTGVRGGSKRKSDGATLMHAGPYELIRLFAGWEQLAPELFSSLMKQVKEWPNKETAKKTLLKKLEQIKEDARERTLTGLLRETVGDSTTRKILSAQRDARVNLDRKAANQLRRAADTLRHLAKLDKDVAVTNLLVSGPGAAKSAEARAEWKADLADELSNHACGLDQEAENVQGVSLRWLGLPAKPQKGKDRGKEPLMKGVRANLEWIVLVKKRFDFSIAELAILVQAAHLAWNQNEVDLHPHTLRKAIDRFLGRNPQLAHALEKEPNSLA